MPIYEYRCEACQEVTELIQKVDAPPPEACSKCGSGPMTKLISLSAFHLKGSGWYSDHYGLKDKPDKKDSGGGSSTASSTGTTTDSTSTDSKPESASTSESKSEAKTESKAEAKTEKKSESSTSSKSDSGTAAA